MTVSELGSTLKEKLRIRGAHVLLDVLLNVLELRHAAKLHLLAVLERDDHVSPKPDTASDGDDVDDLPERHVDPLRPQRGGGHHADALVGDLVARPQPATDRGDGEGDPDEGPGHGDVGDDLTARGGTLVHHGLASPVGTRGLVHGTDGGEIGDALAPLAGRGGLLDILTQWLFGSALSIVLFFILGGKVEVLSITESLKLTGLAFIDIFNYSLFLYTIKRFSATFTTLVDYIVPIVGILMGYIFLSEVISNIFFVTLLLIFISLYLAVKDESKSLS